jgi:hypothetical protein
LPNLIDQAQFIPPLRWSDQFGEPITDVTEEDVPWVTSAHRLPTQKPEVLIETRRKIRIDSSRDLTRTTAHPEPIVAGSVNVDLNAHLARHAPP